jgi:acyl-CoA synthetase (AMP-forming)/AMP-acid ligase II
MIMTPIDVLYQRAKTSPMKVAFSRDGEIWTYERLAAEVDHLAHGLVRRGVRKGDRVALHMANLPEFIVASHACLRTGVIAAPLNIRLKTAELTPLLQRLQPTLYIGQAALYDRVASIDSSILAANSRFVVDGPVNDPRVQPWTSLFADVNGEPFQRTLDAGAHAVLLATSGSTGRPKFVIHTLATLSKIAESYEHLDLDENQISALAMPMVHASGLFTTLAFMRFGVPFALLERFDPDALLDAIVRHRCTWLPGLPFMFTALLQRQRAHARNVDSLRSCLSAGDVCPAHAQDQFPSVFGVPLRSFWAATESLGSLTYGLQPGPVTRITKNAQVRLVGDDKMPVSPGEVGELALRGPNVTIGYWAGPGLIEGAPENGWFYTGDLMRQDGNGDLWFVSRKKHLIIRGGSNIAPVEIERVLMAHPAVRDAAVIGVPDPELGERVAGFVQLADGEPCAEVNEILAHVAGRLADYKVPESLQIVHEIPRNATGKIDRQMLLKIRTASSNLPLKKLSTIKRRRRQVLQHQTPAAR